MPRAGVRRVSVSICFGLLVFASTLAARDAGAADTPSAPAAKKAHPLASLPLRSIGPAVCSGRVVGFGFHPDNPHRYFAAVASGGVWRTDNSGITWTPVFDNEGSYSIGCVTVDPRNPNVVWVGTGENNSQRSVGYGDGVYKSIDGGRTWNNVGLKASEHIARIVVDPRDSNVVLVAAQGPLWGPGGDRGLYKTTDGGVTWTRILGVSDNTGVTDVTQDPRHPDILLAATSQRRRHVYTLVHGGPESALHRSTDGGKTWTRLKAGLPSVDLGRIGLAIAPSDPDTVYAVVEAAEKQGGVFRSTDRGATWEKRNSFDQQAQYYAHAVVDPSNRDRLYVMNVRIQVSDDGARTLRPLPGRWMHVDHHTMWINPKRPEHYLVGNDGGIYESFDRGENWRHVANLPVAQFYDVTCEQLDTPFYKVYGGTQDNATLGGPVRTPSMHGITNADWHNIVGGDGFHCKVDPTDPNIVYAEFQYGGLVRFDWRNGQRVSIQPQAAVGEPPLRWNWDSPLVLSPHKSTRLYYAANRVYRSEDRGDSWTPISPDLTRQINRDTLPVMGKIQPPEAVSKHISTSFFGNITALAESPLKAGRLYAGTDDGLIQISEDNGGAWRKVDHFPGVPDMTFVARVFASQHQADTVFAAFDNHKNADFAPYLIKSTDAGKTWSTIAGDLPPRGSVLAFAEDPVNPELLFCGTEFGLFVTTDGGRGWHRLKAGLPTIPVRDLCIQKPMSDLVIGTFGRGFYILDDFSSLRHATPALLEKPAAVFPIRDGFLYPVGGQYGWGPKGFLGEAFFASANPGYGVGFTFHLKDALKSRKHKRKDAAKANPNAYPKLDDLRAEEEEEAPAILIDIRDAAGAPIQTLPAPGAAGLHRIFWDLRLPAVNLPRLRSGDGGDEDEVRGSPGGGAYAVPGDYTMTLVKRESGRITPLAEPAKFRVRFVGATPLAAADQLLLTQFQQQIIRLGRDLTAVQTTGAEMKSRLDQIRLALDVTPAAPAEAREKVRAVIAAHRDSLRRLSGDAILAARNENTPMSVAERVGVASAALASMVNPPTGTQKEQADAARKELDALTAEFKQRLTADIKPLEDLLDKLGAPHTPGRLPAGAAAGQ